MSLITKYMKLKRLENNLLYIFSFQVCSIFCDSGFITYFSLCTNFNITVKLEHYNDIRKT